METSATTSTAIAATNYAGFGQRLVAWIIDSIILSILYMVVIAPIVGIFAFGVAQNADNLDNMSEAEALSFAGGAMAMVAAIWIATIAVVMLYYAFMESSKFQGSVGKMALGLKVVDLNGNRLSFGKALLRAFGRLFSSMFLCIGYIMAAFTEKKQALHDMIASTLVVKK